KRFSTPPTTIFSTAPTRSECSSRRALWTRTGISLLISRGPSTKSDTVRNEISKNLLPVTVHSGLHLKNPVFKRMSFHDKLKQVIRGINYEEPKIVQSMYIFKQPKIGGAVTDHIDATFLFVEPIDHLVGLWIAVDDADEENGCLAFIPGSHKRSSVDYRFVRTHKTDGSPLLKFTGERPTYDQSKFVSVPVKKGSLIIIHGLVVHKSEPNTSTKSRHAYTLHIMEGKNTKWSPDNWYENNSKLFHSLQ
ncbi:unnamed protein product, partial [Nippostrongylus brasiliensis]|uniref:Phytanoyl-CoA dioxygenase n=1 Tax=Nippostrongylus brasiliensis TaxID=27835 RepID=A0A0N4XCI3_NIPBR